MIGRNKMLDRNTIHNLDWLDLCSQLADGSVDAIVTDPPYGQTNIQWDNRVNLEAMWEQFRRVITPQGAIVITAVQPFTSMLVMSALDLFRYEWIYEKTMATDFMNVSYRPMRAHENVLVFSKGKTTGGANGGEFPINYTPQMEKGKAYVHRNRNGFYEGYAVKGRIPSENLGTRYPRSVLKFNNANAGSLHPTQKPLELMDYIVKTYTQPGDLICDPFAGSGTTAVAAMRTKRDFIIGDSDAHYCNVARERLRTSLDEPHYITRDNDVTTMPTAEGYERHLFAEG